MSKNELNKPINYVNNEVKAMNVIKDKQLNDLFVN